VWSLAWWSQRCARAQVRLLAVVLAVLVTARSTEFWSGQAARCVRVLLDGSLLLRHGNSLPVFCWADCFQL